MLNKRIWAAALVMALSLLFVCADAESIFMPGAYTGTSPSMHGPLTVEINLSESALTAVRVVSHDDTWGVCDAAIARIPAEMVERQVIETDAISGSTITSRAIMRAVADAFKTAGADASALANFSKTEPERKDTVVDTEVVVVGGGGAGLTAAITAAEAGAKVVIVEKMPRLGGNTLICGAYMNAFLEEDYEAAGLADQFDVDYFIDYTYEGGNGDGDLALIRTLIENSDDAYRWLRDDLGVGFYDWGASFGHMPLEINGIGFIKPMIERVHNLGIEYYLDAKVDSILKDGNKVTGVTAVCADGTLTVNASKAVILASGGLGANLNLVHQLDNRYDDIHVSTNQVGATGDGFALAEAAGAALVNLESVQAVPFAYPGTGEVDYGLDTVNTIFVNAEGKRFMEEESKRDVAVAAIQAQTSDVYYSIGDAKDWPSRDTINGFNYTLGTILDRGRGIKADSLEELAKLIHVDAETLIKTVEEYNAMVEAGEDTRFNRTDMATRQKIDTAPYYAGPRTIAIHYANGGVKINPAAEVIGTDGCVIENFFAAGEVTGGVMGTNRMGGNGVADAITFGRIAGESAAK